MTRSSTRIILLGLALVAGSVMTACGSSAGNDPGDGGDGAVRVVEPAVAAGLLDDGTDRTVIDVRTPEEFDEAHLDGALLIDFHRDDFETAISELDPDQPYVIYCRSGNRSGQARELMADLGFADVADIEGGIVAWEAEGLPTVK